jgi:prepilin-type N-terminal cleavage/methylation domain-containing protein
VISSFRSKSGFTLIELMIAMVILAFISLAIYQATTNTFKLRDTLSTDGDFQNEIRLTMSVFEKDIAHVFHPKIMEPPKNTQQVTNAAGQTAATPLPEVQITRYWGALMNTSGARHSRFIGTADSISFVGASHVRVYKASRESVFSKIEYRLEDDKVSPEELGALRTLVKREDTDVFNPEDDRSEFIRKFPLLHGIKKLKFRYYRKDKETWVDDWDSDNSDFKNIFPDLVEMTLEVTGGERKHFEGQFRFRLEVPIEGISPNT